MNWKLAIPSYKRPEIIVNKTLKLCTRLNINKSDIYIFILKEDEKDYINAIPDYHTYNLIIADTVTTSGLHHMRNYITNYFAENQMILSMDDDIDDIYELFIDENVQDPNKSSRYKLIPIDSQRFHYIIIYAFNLLVQKNIGLFGFYPIKNGFFMKDSEDITYSFKFCVGSMWGCLNQKDITITIEEKEDVERTIKYFQKFKKTLRFNHINIATKYYKNPGGMQFLKEKNARIENSKKSAKFLSETYPELCYLHTSKKSGIWEVKLINK